MKTTVITNIRDERGCPKTKAEVILELVKSTAMSGYRYPDRAEELYNSFVNKEIFIEGEMEV
jgi:hypothetical protein